MRKPKNKQRGVVTLRISLQPLPVYGEFSSLVLALREKACERACKRGLADKTYRQLNTGALIKEALATTSRSLAIGSLVHEALSKGAQTAGDLATKVSATKVYDASTSATGLLAEPTTALEALDNKKTQGAVGKQNGAVLHSDGTDLSDLAALSSASTAPLPPGAESLSAAAAQDLTDGSLTEDSLTDSSLTEQVLTTSDSLMSLVVSKAWSHSPFLTCRRAGSPGAFCSPFTTTIPSFDEAADNNAASSPITNHMKSLERQLCPACPSRRAEAAVFGRRSKRTTRRKDFAAMHRSLTAGQLQDCLRAGAAKLTCDEAFD
ncbi:MAG: hypothetical protein IJ228_06260 [Succinivibrio sp.]|nr:hypothetical protein [Succinivibrio sp.]